VIKKRDSSSLYLPALVANLVNALLWVIYGYFAIQNPMLYIPNGAGVILATAQIGLAVAFKRPDDRPSSLASDGSKVISLTPSTSTSGSEFTLIGSVDDNETKRPETPEHALHQVL
jgi:Sugar efflux transporter for intercellular exchange